MAEISNAQYEEGPFWRLPTDELAAVTDILTARCKAAGIEFKIEYDDEGDGEYSLALKSGRSSRVVSFWDQNDLPLLADQDFEKYVFLSGLHAICNYEAGTIEAMIGLPGPSYSPNHLFEKLFGISPRDARKHGASLEVKQVDEAGPKVEFGVPTELFKLLTGHTSASAITLKISNLKVRQHDEALNCLNSIANALLFQLDLVSNIALVLKRVGVRHRKISQSDSPPELYFPNVEFDSAPLSLYWYGRSAVGMPLLQYLAFYQVIEFYFPRYSQSEAHRKLKSVLKNPTFRSDRDSDVAKLLDAIYISRSGAYGDERSQLRATLDECTYSDELKKFILADEERAAFFSSKSKSSYHKINVAAVDGDVRADVAKRIYEIRCNIVHTKSDSRDLEVELLLPFSKEADQLRFDVELIQYVAQQVLIAGGSPLGKF